uniref:Uncharacterized protein n=1 Tax=Tetraselmis sp. GSL018 TaxID=582737 RepID=A0A061SB33_9CHLO
MWSQYHQHQAWPYVTVKGCRDSSHRIRKKLGENPESRTFSQLFQVAKHSLKLPKQLPTGSARLTNRNEAETEECLVRYYRGVAEKNPARFKASLLNSQGGSLKKLLSNKM